MSSQISLTIQAKEKYLTYNATGLNDQHDLAVIQGMFAVFGCCDNGPSPLLPPAVVAGAQQVAAASAVLESPVTTQPSCDTLTHLKVKQHAEVMRAKMEQEQPVSRPRQLPLINSNHTTTPLKDIPPVAEKLIEAGMKIAEKTGAEVPEHIATGIKLKEIGGEIKRMYRCRNNCPNCGQTSNSYLLPQNQWSKCFHCGTKLAVIPATPGEPLVPDDNMNFFYAEEEYYEVGYDDDQQQGSESDPRNV